MSSFGTKKLVVEVDIGKWEVFGKLAKGDNSDRSKKVRSWIDDYISSNNEEVLKWQEKSPKVRLRKKPGRAS